MTTNTIFQRKLTQTANAAEKHNRLQQEVGEMFKERYGVHYSDVDCDSVIDALDINGGNITVEQCDEYMTTCGHPPLGKK
jgi:hypothetical protein